MDFNMKKLASDAGLFFTRAVQFTEEKLGQAEKTELDPHLENLLARADATKNWTEKVLRQTEALLQPNPSARIEEFIYDKLDRKLPSKVTNAELLGQHMLDAAADLGPETPYGSTLTTVGEYQKRLGGAEREFLYIATANFLTPLRNFLEGDWRTISKERRLLENRRLDLDICKARVKKAKQAEAKAAAAPDFQETRPRNYVLSASASALLSEEVDKVRRSRELRVAQTEFDRQAEVTRLLLEGISSTHLNHLRCLHDFAEAQASYYAQCHHYTQELQRELSRRRRRKASAAPAADSSPCLFPHRCANPAAAAPKPSAAASSSHSALGVEQTPLAVTGTRKAKVLYDYDAHDASELSLLADELITVYTVPGMDPDWLVGERGNDKGKVPVTYLELLS
uniref:SH3 domain containing GRB2 like, endophilin B2 n=1 Tax=Tetraodon nigroviridis TaxID=99883 RepID=H3C8T5_TETNG